MTCIQSSKRSTARPAARYSSLCIAFVLALCCATANAREVEVTVVVLDPQSEPIEGASVRLALGMSTLSEAIERTDANGETVFRVEVPDDMPTVIRALIFDNPPATTPREHFFGELEALQSIRMFLGGGYPVQVMPNENAVRVITKANAAELRSGAADSVSGAIPTLFFVFDAGFPVMGFVLSGRFHAPTPTDREFLAGLKSDFGVSYHFVPPLKPGESVPALRHQVPEATGGLAGTVSREGPPDEWTVFLSLTAEGGEYDITVSVDQQGRLASNEDNGPDPASPNQRIPVPPGNYVVTVSIPKVLLPGAESFAYLHALHTGAAAAERAALPRITIEPGKRTIVALDLETLTSTTEALIQAVYFSPQ